MNPMSEKITTAIPNPPAPIEAAPPERSSARRIFFGPYGLRAGWSLLIYLLILVSIVLSIWSHLKTSQQTAATATSTAATPPPQSTTPPAQSAEPAGQATTAADPPQSARDTIISESIVFAVFVLLSWLMAFIERRRVAVFGLSGHRPVSRFLFGAFWGFAVLSLLVGLLYDLHLPGFDTRLLHGFAVLRWGATLLVGFLLVGLFAAATFGDAAAKSAQAR